MNNAGEYAQPLTRTTDVKAPVVAGTTTVRLRASTPLPQGEDAEKSATLVRVVNRGETQVTLQLRETNDYSGSSDALGSSLTVVPHGQRTEVVYPTKKYVELRGLTGTGEVQITLSSQIQYERLAFDKVDGQFPQGIVSSKLPGWSTL